MLYFVFGLFLGGCAATLLAVQLEKRASKAG
jgi:hypothetical protein